MELSEKARAAVELARSHPFSYAVRILASPEKRLLVVVGEAHLKLGKAARIGAQLVDAFELRGVEGFPKKRVLAGDLLKLVIEGPRLLLRIASLGALKGSTIVGARRAGAFLLESVSPIPLALHVASLYLSLFFLVTFASLAGAPQVQTLAGMLSFHMLALIPAYLLQGRGWNWLIHPAIALLDVRNRMMAEGTLAMFRDQPSESALVIMGRAHLPGYEKELVERHGFTPVA